MRLPSIQDVKMLIPGLPDNAQTATMIASCLMNAQTYVKAKIAKVCDPAGDIPLGTTATLYYACSDLMTAIMSSNNENGETKLSEWYRSRADEIIKSLLDGDAIALDTEGRPIDSEPSQSSPGLSLVTY